MHRCSGNDAGPGQPLQGCAPPVVWDQEQPRCCISQGVSRCLLRAAPRTWSQVRHEAALPTARGSLPHVPTRGVFSMGQQLS